MGPAVRPARPPPMQSVRACGRPVAIRSRGAERLPTVHCIDDTNPLSLQQESTMNRTFAAQAISFSLAVMVTVGTLMGLDRLASTDSAAQQQQIAAAKAPQG